LLSKADSVDVWLMHQASSRGCPAVQAETLTRRSRTGMSQRMASAQVSEAP
jgi:hypothetical protein